MTQCLLKYTIIVTQVHIMTGELSLDMDDSINP